MGSDLAAVRSEPPDDHHGGPIEHMVVER